MIISANFLIKRSLFLDINKAETKNLYGLDYLFGALLNFKKSKVHHIDNEVYHLGIDENMDYLDKTRKAVETLYYINKDRNFSHHEISLLHAYQNLKRFGIHRIFGKILLNFNKRMEKNLLGENPSLFMFDLYRLGHFCRLKN